MPKDRQLILTGDSFSIDSIERIIEGILKHSATGHSYSVSATDGKTIEIRLGDWDGDGGASLEIEKIKLENTTTASLDLKPGSGFGFGTDKLDKEQDKLLKQRKKELPKSTIKQFGEKSMSTVATFSGNSRESIGLQFNIINMHNKTTSDMWTLSPIQSKGSSHSFTVTSTQPDKYLTKDNLDRNTVAGISVSITSSSNISESEEIAESMINAISSGSEVKSITEAYLDKDAVFEKEDESDEKNDGESDAIDGIQKDILAMMRMTDDLKMSDADAKKAKGLLDQAMALMKGGSGSADDKDETKGKKN